MVVVSAHLIEIQAISFLIFGSLLQIAKQGSLTVIIVMVVVAVQVFDKHAGHSSPNSGGSAMQCSAELSYTLTNDC